MIDAWRGIICYSCGLINENITTYTIQVIGIVRNIVGNVVFEKVNIGVPYDDIVRFIFVQNI